MKKYITLLLLPLLFACSDDDNNYGTVQIDRISSYHRNSLNENNKYYNYFSAVVVNTTNKNVIGKVVFTIKDYGELVSDTKSVTNQKGYEVMFTVPLETKEIIDESYLLNAEFVRE